MPKYNVMITRTRSVVSTHEMEVTAKDEESAEKKAAEKVLKALKTGLSQSDLDFEETSDESDDFEYEVSEA